MKFPCLMTRFFEVKEHGGKLLNKAANALAGTAAKMDLTTPMVYAEGVYFYYLETLLACI